MNRFTLLALTVAAFVTFDQARAQIVPISIQSTVAVNGYTYVPPQYGGQRDDYSITHTFSDNAMAFSDSISGEATAQITNPPPTEWYPITRIYASSVASQSITVGQSTISLDLNVYTETSFFASIAPFSFGQSDTDIHFRVNGAQKFTFSGDFSYHSLEPWHGFQGGARLSLISASGSHIFDYTDGPMDYSFEYYPNTSYPIPFGIMEPGEYILSARMHGVGGQDPFHTTFGNASVILSVSPVPDPAPTFFSLLLSVAALGAYRTAWRRVNRVAPHPA